MCIKIQASKILAYRFNSRILCHEIFAINNKIILKNINVRVIENE